MTISVNDRRLLTGKKSTLKKLQKLTVEGPEATKALEAARTVLSESIEEYDRAIRREDLTDEVREILQGPRGKASEAFVRVYYTLKRQYAERRARLERRQSDRRSLTFERRRMNWSDLFSRPDGDARRARSRSPQHQRSRQTRPNRSQRARSRRSSASDQRARSSRQRSARDDGSSRSRRGSRDGDDR